MFTAHTYQLSLSTNIFMAFVLLNHQQPAPAARGRQAPLQWLPFGHCVLGWANAGFTLAVTSGHLECKLHEGGNVLVPCSVMFIF